MTDEEHTKRTGRERDTQPPPKPNILDIVDQWIEEFETYLNNWSC